MNSRQIFKALVFLSLFDYSCKSSNNRDKSSKSAVNHEAPFYSHRLPEGSPRITKNYDSSKIQNYSPFIVYNDGSYMIAAEIETKDLLEKFNPIFEKYGYSGNGYSWEGHIKQILEKENPALLNHIRFDPEAGGFYAFADGEESQLLFAKQLAGIFNNPGKLEFF
jgi:hypothetical protein